jgi:4-alpha-glucanotransferase
MQTSDFDNDEARTSTALERSIMSASTIVASPFARARELARERSVQEQQQLELARAAENEQRDRIKREEEAQRKLAYLEKDVQKFIEGFAEAVVKRATDRKWKLGALELAERYVVALISHEDVELPKMDNTMSTVIHDAFAYGMAMYMHKSRQVNIPDDYFVGQRQDWFSELLNYKLRTFS